MSEVICQLAKLYLIVLFARILLSWFPISPDSPMATVFSLVYSATEPVLSPIRRAIPPMQMGGMGLDLSVLIVIFGYQLLVIPLLCG